VIVFRSSCSAVRTVHALGRTVGWYAESQAWFRDGPTSKVASETPRPPLAELLIDCEEDRVLRTVLVGMLREADRSALTSRERRLVQPDATSCSTDSCDDGIDEEQIWPFCDTAEPSLLWLPWWLSTC
jgi:hypothetical protein